MPTLKATEAREIEKTVITEAETLVFEGRVISQTGKQLMEPGEFYFRLTTNPIWTNASWLARFFGAAPKQSWRDITTSRHYSAVACCP